jgi:murein DD-endopeptidase MepM/ murein hydrolase activator NlpD
MNSNPVLKCKIPFPIFCLFTGLFFLFNLNFSPAQTTFPKNYFASPLDGELLVTGSYGELRTNHLHSGIDLKTENEGRRVYAVAAGYVSRIKISRNGFGKAIYVTHPNGYVSLYAHLSKFSPKIEAYVKKAQYKKESFEIELFPSPFEFPLLKSEQIAFSGNTGGSGGPHLHFEIRDALTEEVLNPLLFGMKIKDTVAPVLERLIIYPYGNGSAINGSAMPLKLNIGRENGEYLVKTERKIEVSGKFYVGIEAHDKEIRTRSTNGVYSLRLSADGQKIYFSELNRFSFSVSRYINAHVDYAEKIKDGSDVQLCHIRPNNKLPIYKNIVNKGIIEFKTEGKHLLEMEAKDSYGNASYLKFDVYSSRIHTLKNKESKEGSCDIVYKHDVANHFEDGALHVKIPAFALYDSLCFHYGGRTKKKGFISDVYKIQDPYTPLQASMDISIKAGIPERLRDKVLLARINDKDEIISEGGNWSEGVVKTRSRNFGDYGIVVDTIPPALGTLQWSDKKNQGSRGIKLRIEDKLSGIKSYRGNLDGNWILMEYDEKSGNLFHEYEENLNPGKHIFNITVFDNKNNVSTMEENINIRK